MLSLIAEHAPLLGLLFFFLVFSGIALWAFNPKQRKKIEAYKYIPLSETSDEQKQ